MSRDRPVGSPGTVRIDRIVVRCAGDQPAGEQLKQRLPAVLRRRLTELPADERAVRREVEQAAREAWR